MGQRCHFLGNGRVRHRLGIKAKSRPSAIVSAGMPHPEGLLKSPLPVVTSDRSHYWTGGICCSIQWLGVTTAGGHLGSQERVSSLTSHVDRL